MIRCLTQGFTRGFFRNPDERPAQVRITRFQGSPRLARHAGAPYKTERVLHSAPEGSKEWLLEESAAIGRAAMVAQMKAQQNVGRPEMYDADDAQAARERDDEIYGRHG